MDNKRRIAIVRETITKVTRILSGRGIRVTQSGMNAFVEYHPDTLAPVRVNVPFLPDDASDELISAIEGFVDHEVGHLLFSDSKAAEQSVKRKVAALTNICEDVFIERMMKKQFSGSSHNLEKMYHIFTNRFIEPKFKDYRKDPAKTEREYWHLLVACAIRALGGQRHFADYMEDKWELIPNIHKAIEPFTKRILSTTDSFENLELAVDIKKAVYGEDAGEEKDPHKAKTKSRKSSEDKEDETYEPPSDLDDEGEDESHFSSSDSEDKEPEEPGKDEAEETDSPSDESGEEETESPKPDDGEDEEMDSEESTSSDESIDDLESEEFPEDDDDIPMLEGDGDSASTSPPLEGSDAEEDETLFEEFDDAMSDIVSEMSGEGKGDADYFPFTKDWDRVEEFVVPPEFNSRWIDAIEGKVTGMTGTLQKGLERAFRAANKSRWEGGKKRGRVNSSALGRLLNNDPRVFRTKEEMKTKEVAVSLLIDCSGSMSGGRIHVATETAWALSEVLSKLNINFEVLGFTTDDGAWRTDEFRSMYDEMMGGGHATDKWSRLEPVYVPIFKGFNERFGVEQKKRMASIPRSRFLANNVDGESLEYAANRLLRQREPGKTLIVLSDGQPCAYGSTYGFEKHLKSVIKDLSKKQVNVVGIGIQTTCVNSYYPKSVVIDRIEDLPTQVMHQLRDAIMQK
ncbi:putative Porphyrin biosynthetic protein [Vibrio coralliirubri]|uniref:cobaltochelatase CobT-related protein n=1 Tax=Vibrio coralliirubri TaxID=1516159 RepID=UPI0006346273|nr:hypothetical protein [Vibrio coralliirubri]CDT53764.1 putative Porphyrin biosynthetic protein [Vibrio coralliirubri]